MNLRYCTIIGSLSALTALSGLLAPIQAQAQEQGVEELTRGPVHEAFAASVSYDPQPGIIVKTAPPAMIEEVPPDQRPEGDNVAWIPGYWGWDEEQNDFIWISGIWRNLPPGRQWVPGYWSDLGGQQWQWTSGYWADQATQEVTYLPQPPKSIETGPNVEAPSPDYIWISGSWIDRDDRYVWRPGYWDLGQPLWTWIPAHYIWTRHGYVFIDGFWDYNVDRRGVLFAPVRFRHDFYNRPDYYYTPELVISLDVFLNHLFVRPGYYHYYFGDYYAARYRNEGFFASFAYQSGRHGYDPIYSHSLWEHRHDSGWEHSRRTDFAFYRDHKDARPPSTLAALMALPAGHRGGLHDHFALAEPLKSYALSHNSGLHFQTLSKDSRDKIAEGNKDVRKFGQDRLRMETHSADKSGAITRETLGKSPVLGKRVEQFSGNDAPPKIHASHNAIIPDGTSTTHGADVGKHNIIPDGKATTHGADVGRHDIIPDGKSTTHGSDIGKHNIIPDGKATTHGTDVGKHEIIPNTPNKAEHVETIHPGKGTGTGSDLGPAHNADGTKQFHKQNVIPGTENTAPRTHTSETPLHLQTDPRAKLEIVPNPHAKTETDQIRRPDLHVPRDTGVEKMTTKPQLEKIRQPEIHQIVPDKQIERGHQTIQPVQPTAPRSATVQPQPVPNNGRKKGNETGTDDKSRNRQ